MPNDSLAVLENTLGSIEAAEVRRPGLPPAIAHQEAHDLLTFVDEPAVRERLLAVGLEAATLDALAEALTASRQAQSRWIVVRDRRKGDAQREREARGAELRSEMVAAGRWNLRGARIAQGALDAIMDGDGVADLVQDLHDLGHLVHAHVAAFDKDQSFDAAARAEEALALSTEIETGLSAERLTTDQAAAIELRDRAYTHLRRLVLEIRAAGRYAFRDDEDALPHFGSAYERRSRRSRRAE